MKRLLLLISFLLISSARANDHVVHFVYLIPTDKTPVALQAITNSALHLQAWYRNQMGGKTFTPVVEVYYTPHDSTWYSTHLPVEGVEEPAWWWYNVWFEAHDLTYDPNAQGITGVWDCCECCDDWVVYIDAPLSSDQWAGSANDGTMGLCEMAGKDLASLQGIDPDWTQCRGIGGSGHEMGHTLGLEHPAGPPNPEWYTAIMGLGYLSYPDDILTQADKDHLNTSPFFDVEPYQDPPVNLCPFPTSTPTPTPTASPSATSTPTPTVIPLPAPHANNADQVQNTSFRAKWSAVNGALSYRLDVATNNTFLNYVLQDVDVGNVVSAVVTGLTRHTDYYYRVRAYNGVSSPNSNVIHVKTK